MESWHYLTQKRDFARLCLQEEAGVVASSLADGLVMSQLTPSCWDTPPVSAKVPEQYRFGTFLVREAFQKNTLKIRLALEFDAIIYSNSWWFLGDVIKGRVLP